MRRTPILLLLALVASLLPVAAAAQSPGGADVVISQVYGGGGNSGAPYTHDYVEVFNRSGATVDLDGLSLQYASATGTGNLGANAGQLVALSGSVPAGGYHLVRLAGGTTGDPLPAPDDTGTINMGATGGKIALVEGTAGLGCNGGSTPCDDAQLDRIIDLVGFGNANFSEGSAAPAPSNTTAIFRADDGCTDTDDNAADFATGAPAPRNSSSPTAPCGGGEPIGPVLVISQVYGGGGNSGAPYTHDYVEVFNRGDAPASLTDLSIQYTSATGTGNFGANAGQLVALTGSVPAGGYHLVRLAGGSTGDPLPAPDDTGTINMSATAGKVALVEGTDSLGCNGGSNPCSDAQLDRLVDLVGFGSANFFEGDAAAPAPSNTTAIFRADGGCTDTDDNRDDFATGAPAPRNSASPANVCDPSVDQPIIASCQNLAVDEGTVGSVELSATDGDGTVVEAAITDGATDGIALADPSPATEPGGTYTVQLTAADHLAIGTYPLTVTFTNAESGQTGSCEVTVTVRGDVCEVPDTDLTPIHEIQGDGAATPIPGVDVVTRGVVTTDFTSGGETANEGLRGFHIEALAEDRDDDPLTSEGLFVFEATGTFTPELGTLVHVEGTAGEAFEVTQVDADRIALCDAEPAALPPAADLPLPVHPSDRAQVLEPLESMRVTHSELTVVEFFQLERFGEVRLSSGGVLDNPTNVVDPRDDEAYQQVVAFNAANTIVLDDGRTGQNLDPLPYVIPGDTLRIGDQLRDHTTVLHYGFGQWRLQPIDIDAITAEFPTNRTRPRPETAPDVGGDLVISAFNVLNYFNGDGYFVGDDPQTASGFPTQRGAVTPSEFHRQTEKIVDAMVRMDADVFGLIEVENDAGERQATAALVDALNTELGTEVYDYVDTGRIGTDQIKLAYVYKPATVEPVGDHAILDSSVDPRFEDQRSRPALAQTFRELASGEAVTVTVNHLKSKGSACAAADNDPRQGNCNGVRTRAAEAIADWLATDPTGQDARGHLIIGDLNAYAKEDPIVALQDAGYTDLKDHFAPEGTTPYSYTFDATQGYLDHALADPDLLPFVTGAASWHINADEVPAIDYQESCCGVSFNQRFRTADVAERFYDPSAFRSSDHDPVLIGLQLADTPPPDRPTTKDDCRNGGWRDYQDPSFRNQGQCVAWVAAGRG